MFKLSDRVLMNVKTSWCEMNKLPKLNNLWISSDSGKVLYTTKRENKDLELPINEARKFYNAHLQTDTGIVYDKKPFKVHLLPNKIYYWCTCGESKTQPFCDGTHKIPQLKIKLRPVRLEVSKEKDYWLCNCKQTNNRPFCDGSHKHLEVQEK